LTHCGAGRPAPAIAVPDQAVVAVGEVDPVAVGELDRHLGRAEGPAAPGAEVERNPLAMLDVPANLAGEKLARGSLVDFIR
jgi:hypothetical protein